MINCHVKCCGGPATQRRSAQEWRQPSYNASLEVIRLHCRRLATQEDRQASTVRKIATYGKDLVITQTILFTYIGVVQGSM